MATLLPNLFGFELGMAVYRVRTRCKMSIVEGVIAQLKSSSVTLPSLEKLKDTVRAANSWLSEVDDLQVGRRLG